MKISLAQLNPVIGDFSGNLRKAEQAILSVRDKDPDLIVFPELFLSGYPPQDLLQRPHFIDSALSALDLLVQFSCNAPETAVLCGTVQRTAASHGKRLHNSAVLFQNGEILFLQHKALLPSYDVFDETRYFEPVCEQQVCPFRDEILGITICEDIWNDADLFPDIRYASDPVKNLADQGATLFINISASPFGMGKEEIRSRLMQNHIRRHGRPFVMLNQVGGNDELIFDGKSMAMDGQGRMLARLPGFRETIETVDMRSSPPESIPPVQDDVASVHDALVFGIREYMTKCGFQSAVLGLSGGVDSALVAVLACRALGPDHVLGVAMPSPYSSKESLSDARDLAANLRMKLEEIPITSLFSAYLTELKPLFRNTRTGTAEENIQSRIRGNLLMAVSNKFGHLCLATGNKSELSMGYCTLYGDMSGGLSVLADVPKTWVYRLAEWINRSEEVIPRSVIVKAPSAELKPGQKDQDSLPPYDTLDRILDLYLHEQMSAAAIIDTGLDRQTVEEVIRTVERNEYKRRQAAPGLKITTRAFGVGRRMPVAARYSQPS